jgi:SSS family solute:Na+ symporter
MDVTSVLGAAGAFKLHWFDIGVFLAFFGVVVGVSMYKSRKEETGEDYFLAGRGLTWPLIGFSLIAANISTEHFVGMSGQGAGMGLAIASYEWIAAITLVFVALLFLPKFLRSGIFTIPEFLEYRYNSGARSIMAFYVMIMYVVVAIAAVVYSGGLTLQTIFGDVENATHLKYGILLIGTIAALYTIWGGLKAVAWADLFQGSALIIGGAITMVLGFVAIGKLHPSAEAGAGIIGTLSNGIQLFSEKNTDKLHMFLPKDHPIIPWTALIVGIWIPNFYYWGLNQFITQRTLAAKTLRQGQLGIIFAAALKLLIPFIMVFPGIMAVQLYREQVTAKNDAAYPLLIRNLISPGLRGFIFAAISGAVISSLASMLNSASTIFTMDLYKRLINNKASQKSLVWMGRLMTLVFVVAGCLIAPNLGSEKFKGIFNYIQETQGFITPGILAAFAFGLIFKRAPSAAGISAMALNVPVYGIMNLKFFEFIKPIKPALGSLRENAFIGRLNELAFLNQMAITFGVLIVSMSIISILKPLKEPRVMPVREEFDMRPTPAVIWLGALVIVVTLALYVIFR